MNIIMVLEWLRDWDGNAFMPHGMCYMWQPTTLWSNVLGDSIIALSYFLIPVGLIYFVRQRKDFEMPGILVAFALFIISCGTVHTISVVNVWVPLYNTAGILKGITAVVSVGTLALMFIKMPMALAIPTPSELQKVNEQLLLQIQEKERLQKELEEKADKLEDTVRLLSATQEAANIGAWRADLKKDQLFWSDQVYRIHDVGIGAELKMEHGINFYREEYREEVQRTVQKAISEQIPWDRIWQLKTGENTYKWVRAIGYPVLENEQVIALEGLFMDIDEQKKDKLNLEKYTEELEEKNKELESFSYSISHDLRAPLRSINGFSDILMEELSEEIGEEGKRLLKIIKENALKMGGLIDDILDYSRVGRYELTVSPIDMNVLVNTVVEELTHANQHLKIKFSIGNLEPLTGDSVLIKQVFQNLIDNAIKYSSLNEEVVVEIGSKKLDRQVQYYIKDNGVGFDEKYLEKIFGVFQRLHSNTEFSGTGVGLAIVKKIIEKHKGRVWAKSSKGMGATFYLTMGE